MRRLKKNIFLGLCGGVVAVLGMVRLAFPEVTQPKVEAPEPVEEVVKPEQPAVTPEQPTVTSEQPVAEPKPLQQELFKLASTPEGRVKWHPVRSVYSYTKCFPDVQDVQIQAAMHWGVKPVRNREEAEYSREQLVYVGASPLYCIDEGMRHSIPYLVPRASHLLSLIGRNYLDSLYVKGVPLHRIIVSSVLRTEDDVSRLQRRNGNATSQSCHLFGTTFDVCYNRFSTVSPPGEPERRAVQNDTLKWVLSEVLRDIREQGLCYIKYEVKQGCFHITVK